MTGQPVNHLTRKLGWSLHHLPWTFHTIPLKNMMFEREAVFGSHTICFMRHITPAVCPAHNRCLHGQEGSNILPNVWSAHNVITCFKRHCLPWRHFHSSGPSIHQLGTGIGKSDNSAHRSFGVRESDTSVAAWALRLSNENNYLSWCRNTYLTTVVGIAMLGEGASLLAQHAAEGAFFVAGVNLLWGTGQLFYNVFYLRRRMEMSWIWAILYLSMATLHLLLWLMVCLLYIGYTDDQRRIIAIGKDSDNTVDG